MTKTKPRENLTGKIFYRQKIPNLHVHVRYTQFTVENVENWYESGAISTTSLWEANLLFMGLGFGGYFNFPGALEHRRDGKLLPRFLVLAFLQCLVLLFEHHEGLVSVFVGLQRTCKWNERQVHKKIYPQESSNAQPPRMYCIPPAHPLVNPG